MWIFWSFPWLTLINLICEYKFTYFIRFGTFGAIVSSNIFSAAFCPLSVELPKFMCWSSWWCHTSLSSVYFFISAPEFLFGSFFCLYLDIFYLFSSLFPFLLVPYSSFLHSLALGTDLRKFILRFCVFVTTSNVHKYSQKSPIGKNSSWLRTFWK